MGVPRKGGRELQGEVFVACWPQSRHGHTLCCLQPPAEACEAGGWGPFTGEVQVPQLAKWMQASAPDAERTSAVCRPLAKEVKAEPWGVSTPQSVKYKLILEH